MKISPFDLHVLSTPPAFILSQDQTLKIVFILTSLNWHFLSLLKLGFVRFSDNMSDSKPEIVLNHLESSGLHCCSTVKVQKARFNRVRELFYNIEIPLSTLNSQKNIEKVT